MKEIKIPVVEVGNGGFSVAIDLNIYAQEAINATCYKYTDKFYVHLQTSSQSEKVVDVVMECKDGGTTITQDLIKQFCNDLLDQQVRVDVNSQFGHIRDLIVEEAFKPVIK